MFRLLCVQLRILTQNVGYFFLLCGSSILLSITLPVLTFCIDGQIVICLTKKRNYTSMLPNFLSQIALSPGESWAFVSEHFPGFPSVLIQKSEYHDAIQNWGVRCRQGISWLRCFRISTDNEYIREETIERISLNFSFSTENYKKIWNIMMKVSMNSTHLPDLQWMKR